MKLNHRDRIDAHLRALRVPRGVMHEDDLEAAIAILDDDHDGIVDPMEAFETAAMIGALRDGMVTDKSFDAVYGAGAASEVRSSTARGDGEDDSAEREDTEEPGDGEAGEQLFGAGAGGGEEIETDEPGARALPTPVASARDGRTAGREGAAGAEDVGGDAEAGISEGPAGRAGQSDAGDRSDAKSEAKVITASLKEVLETARFELGFWNEAAGAIRRNKDVPAADRRTRLTEINKAKREVMASYMEMARTLLAD